MRFSGYLPIALATVALLALPAIASAQPKPILKPPDTTTHTTATHTTPVTPQAPPTKTSSSSSSSSSSGSGSSSNSSAGTGTGSTTGTGSSSGTGTTTTTTTGAGTGATPPVIVTPLVVTGGRDHANDAPAVTASTTVTTPPPAPTPLAFVAAGDRIPSTATATPAWKLALLALLAAAEAFLVVRLVRNRTGGALTPAS